ncbi:helix-turn-helix domain-containing protein [Guptibacillus hwajinpoensis]|uniref:helix-turn-helix domain-containing protein n=1 Tax=Guptibacillus hwajinpoensis TaxID=208199 RepID=UPI001CFD7A1E|nr:helix-turn-helix domain-containing protein [Pseudalkalibacillus hwajinpoensis]
MYKLVIGDRDSKELLGLKWLISKYSFPISLVKTVNQLTEVMMVLEKELPEILFIELDMIPREKWNLMKTFIDRYTMEVIAVTAEPTFERATEAIEIGAVDLIVKPLSPLKIKSSLQKAFRNVTEFKRREKGEELQQTLWYKSLFTDDQLAYRAPVYLMKTEKRGFLGELRQFIDQFNFSFTPLVFSTTDRIVLVFEQPILEPTHQAQRFLREWEQMNEESIVIAVHQGKSDDSLHQIYMKLRKVLEVSFFTGYQQVLHSDQNDEWHDIDPFLTLTEQRHWIYMLEESRMEELKDWLYEHFYGLEFPYPEPGLLRTRLTSILAQIRRFMLRKGLTDNRSEVLYKQVFESILYSPILYRIVQDLILFLTHLLHESVDFRPVSRRNVIEETLIYIDEHYSDPALNLKEVADYVLRNPAYLSHTLTQKYGQSFREILNSTRISKAKELLTSTEESIQSIASHVGFKSPNYFSRVFKETTGKTPGEYRKEGE